MVAAVAWILAARALWQTGVPSDLVLPSLDQGDYFTRAELRRAERYERFFLVGWLAMTAAVVVALAAVAARGPRLAARIGIGRVGTGIVVSVLALSVAWAVVFPFAALATWWERRHGLSRVGYAEALLEAYGALVLEGAVACFVVAILMAIAGRLPRLWWLIAAPMLVALTIGLVLVQPYVFLDAERLRRPALVREARVLADRIGVEGTPVHVDEVHDETTQANALAVGLGPSERVILWDTLLDGRFPRDEVSVVIAHEFGHLARDHLAKGLAWSLLFLFPTLFVVAEVTRRRGGLAHPAVIPLALLILAALNLATSPLYNAISRRYEAEADWVALRATRDPAAARGLFQRFSRVGLADPTPPTWSYVFLGTHPTLMERIAMAEAFARRSSLALPRHGSRQVPPRARR